MSEHKVDAGPKTKDKSKDVPHSSHKAVVRHWVVFLTILVLLPVAPSSAQRTDDPIEQILAAMSIEQRVGQLFMNILMPTLLKAFEANRLAASGQVDVTITRKTGETFSRNLVNKVKTIQGVSAVSGLFSRTINVPWIIDTIRCRIAFDSLPQTETADNDGHTRALYPGGGTGAHRQRVGLRE